MVGIEVELLMVGVSVVLVMMVSLVFVISCTVEVIKVDDEVVETVRVVGFAEVVTTGEVDIINGTDIIDGVVNTVDVSDTDDE